jgi:hypothetical protein
VMSLPLRRRLPCLSAGILIERTISLSSFLAISNLSS